MRRTGILALMMVLVFFGTVPAQARRSNVGDAVINYDISGRRGRTVVFIHGWSHNLSVWDDQVPVFNRSYRVLRYDSPGFGRSTGIADESAEPRDLLVLLESLHIRHVYLVGHSRGANVALRFAVAYPGMVDGLVLEAAVPTTGVPIPPEVGQLFGSFPDIAKKYGLDSVGKLLLTTPITWVPPGRADLTDRYRKLWAAYSGRDLPDPHPESGGVPEPSMARLESLRMPTLIIIGDHEWSFIAGAADTLAHHIPTAKKVVLTNAGHGAHFAQPASFNSALMDFFTDVERSKKR